MLSGDVRNTHLSFSHCDKKNLFNLCHFDISHAFQESKPDKPGSNTRNSMQNQNGTISHLTTVNLSSLK